jgi:hypothetical protein
MQFARLLIYIWVLPTTLVGLLFVPLALMTGGRLRILDGAVEVYGGLVSFFLRRCTIFKGGVSAMTLGHVILGLDAATLDLARTHEHVHIRQCERWGPLFIPAYLLGSLIALMRGGHAYRDNPFEKEAFGDRCS